MAVWLAVRHSWEGAAHALRPATFAGSPSGTAAAGGTEDGADGRRSVTTLLTPTTADALAPVRETLAVMAARPDLPPLHGLVPGLTLTHPRGWVPSTALADGSALD